MSLLIKRPLSVFNPGYFDIFEEFDDFFNDEYGIMNENLNYNDNLYISKEKKLKKQLKRTKQLENNIQKQIDEYQQFLDYLQAQKKEIDQKKDKLMKQIEAINKNSEQNQQTDGRKTKVYKKVFYQTPEIEIEEQYDSTDPNKCYKIIKKQGKIPQILQGSQEQNQKDNNKIFIENGQLSQVNQDKLQKLCKMTNKKLNDLIQFIQENPDLTVGQLYDKLIASQPEKQKGIESSSNEQPK